MTPAGNEKFVYGPLTVEVHVLGRREQTIHYGVKVFLAQEKPFSVQFVTIDSPENVARKVLDDLHLAAENPDKLWKQIEAEVDRCDEASPLPDGARAAARTGFDRMAAWACERPDSVKEAAAAAGIAKGE